MFSKRPANLDEIIDGQQNPTKEEILNSRDFQVNLVNDLINNKRNVTSWEVYEQSGSMEDLNGEGDDQFNIDYMFNFKYNYKGVEIPLSIFINGQVDVDWVGKYMAASHYQPAEHPQPQVDDQNLGRMLDFSLFDDDGSEVDISWITPELEKKVAKSIISPYL